jgi:all-trans-retinol dehydrogenase (NAD+)
MGDLVQGAFSKVKSLPLAAKILLGAAAAYTAREVYLRATSKDITDNVVVITGAGSGIGRITAIKLSESGCRLALWDLDEKSVNRVCQEIKDMKHKNSSQCRAYQVDVTARDVVYAKGKEVLAEFGRVDILINNAGIVSGKKILENSDALMEKTIAVNMTSHLWTIKAFLPDMLKRNSGSVVSIASAAGIVGVAGLIDYCASKYGAVGINESLRAELQKLGSSVDTLCVCPYYVKTEMFSGVQTKSPFLLPILEPLYVADQIVLAIKRRNPYLMMPPFIKIAAAAGRTLPTWLFDAIANHLGVNATMDTFAGHGK